MEPLLQCDRLADAECEDGWQPIGIRVEQNTFVEISDLELQNKIVPFSVPKTLKIYRVRQKK